MSMKFFMGMNFKTDISQMEYVSHYLWYPYVVVV